MSRGIINFQIDKFFKDESEDLQKKLHGNVFN